MDASKRATIVVTTRNRVDDLLVMLASAARQSEPANILVLDDASSDGTSEVVKSKFPQACVRTFAERQGLIRLRNAGAKIANTPFIVSIDDDAIFTTPYVVEQTIECFDEPRVGAVAIPFVDVKVSTVPKQVAPRPGGVYATNTFIGTAHALRRQLFLGLGGYREFFEHQHEEPDFCARLLAAGYIVRLGNSDLINHFASPKREWSRQYFYSARNNLLLPWCNYPMPAAAGRILRATLGNLLFGIRNGLVAPTLKGLACGWSELLSQRFPREPIDRDCYRLLLRLRMGAASLEEIRPLLPPMREIAPGGVTPGGSSNVDCR